MQAGGATVSACATQGHATRCTCRSAAGRSSAAGGSAGAGAADQQCQAGRAWRDASAHKARQAPPGLASTGSLSRRPARALRPSCWAAHRAPARGAPWYVPRPHSWRLVPWQQQRQRASRAQPPAVRRGLHLRRGRGGAARGRERRASKPHACSRAACSAVGGSGRHATVHLCLAPCTADVSGTSGDKTMGEATRERWYCAPDVASLSPRAS